MVLVLNRMVSFLNRMVLFMNLMVSTGIRGTCWNPPGCLLLLSVMPKLVISCWMQQIIDIRSACEELRTSTRSTTVVEILGDVLSAIYDKKFAACRGKWFLLNRVVSFLNRIVFPMNLMVFTGIRGTCWNLLACLLLLLVIPKLVNSVLKAAEHRFQRFLWRVYGQALAAQRL